MIEVPPGPRISLVAALNLRGVIGRDNGLPWKLPRDMTRFRSVTLGKPVLMGRRTFESIGRPLPGRLNVVVSRDPAFAPAGCETARSLTEALALEGVRGAPEIMVIGGSDVYGQLLDRADCLYLTLVCNDLEGDARFPDFGRIVPFVLQPWTAPAEGPWHETARWDYPADERNAWRCIFVTWESVRPPS